VKLASRINVGSATPSYPAPGEDSIISADSRISRPLERNSPSLVPKMRIWRQSHLGCCPQGELCIIKDPPPLRRCRTYPTESLGESRISVLPDELLSEVFSYLPPKDYWEVASDEERFPLTLVSKSWRRIYEPILLRKIRISSYPVQKMVRRIRKLLYLLETRPHLRRHPRQIQLEQYCPPESAYTDLAKVLEYCHAVRIVSLHADLRIYYQSIIEAIKSRPLLEDLRLSGHSSGPSLYLVLKTFNLPNLKRLSLSRYGVGRSSEDLATPWMGDRVPINQLELEELLSPSQYHTGSVTSLELSDPSTPPYVSEKIVSWPARLVHLSITWLTHSQNGVEYNTEAIQRLLDIHRRWLKSINLGMILGGRTGMPDFSKFPCLETVSTSSWNSIRFETPSTALKKLAAPLLRYLEIDFSCEDQHSESASDFVEEQVAWMKDFASVLKSHYPDSKLEKVMIQFNPDVDPHWGDWTDSDEVPWPWEHLEQARQEVAQLGLNLEYSQRWTKGDWDNAVEEVKVKGRELIDDVQQKLSFEPVEV
jgi:hypothetical protein